MSGELDGWIAVFSAVLPFLGQLVEARNEAQQLVADALAGRRKAIEQLVDRLMPVIRGRVKRQLSLEAPAKAADAADLAQHVWLMLIRDEGRQLRAYDPGRGASLETFVGMIAERETSNHLRAERAQKRAAKRVDSEGFANVHDDRAGPEVMVIERDLLDRLCGYLERTLSPLDFAAFRFLFTDGVEPAEVATIMGCSVQAIYNRQNRIRSAARTFLRDGAEEPAKRS
jgi:RNA polymerase sigma-70 factor (ECF subfamily)